MSKRFYSWLRPLWLVFHPKHDAGEDEQIVAQASVIAQLREERVRGDQVFILLDRRLATAEARVKVLEKILRRAEINRATVPRGEEKK